jgi:hypothetical protein
MCLLFLQPCRSGNVLPNQEFFPPDPQQKNCAQRLKIFDRSRLGVLCPGSEFGLSWEAGGTNPGNSDPAQIQHGPNKEQKFSSRQSFLLADTYWEQTERRG